MAINVSIDEAQANLTEIVKSLVPGRKVVITMNDRPVAELRSANTEKPRPQFGNCAGMLAILEEDDEHLADFEEHMP